MKAAGTKAKRSIIASCTVYGSSTRITCASTIATHRNTVPGGALKIGWRSAWRGLRIGEGESIRPRWGRCLLAVNRGDRPRGKQDGAYHGGNHTQRVFPPPVAASCIHSGEIGRA